jgi:prepilin-type N-terminal cleavage/methylation domain-containing protein
MKSKKQYGVTILELIVVLLIISILSTIATQVYTGHRERARFAVARSTIHNIELAASRYEIDLGALPLSSTGNPVTPIEPTQGCGMLMTMLLHSTSGNATAPSSARWHGPYLDVDRQDLGLLSGAVATSSDPATALSLLDPWGNAYYFTRHDDYSTYGATEQTGTANYNLGEHYYNPSTMQIISLGPNGETSAAPDMGLDEDDVNNFYNP